MTIIVKHKRTGNEYILLGMNGGGDRNSLPSRFLNDLFTKEAAENTCLVALCDARGNIFLSDANELIVTEIDGKKPSEILPEPVPPVVNEFQEEDEDNFDVKENIVEVTSERIGSLSDERLSNDEFDDDDWV
ncbi:hypothetical protein IQ238_03035 [Pleurocapsales cyanobacterium LEGE 06147]|nr:hypothetical protein [Pleurocapsales cyanobacterium LEGE 06147]